jgi:hypothetical protein
MGLKKTHVLIKMLSCYAAGSLSRGQGGAVVRSLIPDGSFFARQLAMALFGDGYLSIIVGGYPGPVNTGGAAARRSPQRQQNVLLGMEGPGASVDSHDHIVWVDGRGNPVGRDVITRLKLASDLKEGKIVKTWRGQEFKRN